MSTENLQKVGEIYKEVMRYHGFTSEKELAEHFRVGYKTFNAWKLRNRIADLKPFLEDGFREEWLRTGRGAPRNESTDCPQAVDRSADRPIDQELMKMAIREAFEASLENIDDRAMQIYQKYYALRYGLPLPETPPAKTQPDPQRAING